MGASDTAAGKAEKIKEKTGNCWRECSSLGHMGRECTAGSRLTLVGALAVPAGKRGRQTKQSALM